MKIGNTEIILNNRKFEQEEIKNNLRIFYDTCNKIFMNDDVFYSSEQIKKLKKDRRNIFL